MGVGKVCLVEVKLWGESPLHGVLPGGLRPELLPHRALSLQGEAVCHSELGVELQASAFF